MGFDLKEIISAWAISYNPSAQQQMLADYRIEICNTCPSRKEVLKGVEWSTICGECGCPLSKKVFSVGENACPLKKWDRDHEILSAKSKSTI